MKLAYIRMSKGVKGWTQEGLAELAGVSKWTIKNIELAKHPPRLETMIRVAKALEVELKDIDEFKQRIAA